MANGWYRGVAMLAGLVNKKENEEDTENQTKHRTKPRRIVASVDTQGITPGEPPKKWMMSFGAENEK